MNREEIKNILPHREPMLLVDEVEAVDDTHARGKYHVRGNEYFLQGHFPGNPIVPGVIQCEMMAQACCVLLAGKAEGATPYFTSLNKVKFKYPVRPGDTLEFECELVKSYKNFYFAEGKGHVNQKLCVSGEFSFALVPQE